MSRLSAMLVLAVVLGAGSTTLAAQSDSVARAAAVPCAESQRVAGLSALQVGLLSRAINDPIIGCAANSSSQHVGDFTVAAGDTVRGNILVLDGTLRIVGAVLGSAVALNGAIVVDSNGYVRGDVIAAERGAAIAPVGRVDGELRIIDALKAETPALSLAKLGTFTRVKHTAAWFGVLLMLGIGVLINSGDAMQRVTAALHAGFARNVVVGLLAQLALLPVFVTICLLLTLTLIGVLLVPFAAVAYVIALLGLLVLGGLGAAQMVGSGVAARRAGTSERAARMRAMLTGMILLAIPWFLAAAATSIPPMAAILRVLAFGVTYVALTAGLGAALRTRGGMRSHDEPWGIKRPTPSGKPAPVVASPAADWLTPTPLTGVVAARRPTSGTGSAR